MRANPRGPHGPTTTYRPRTTLAGFLAAVALPVGLVLALAAPVATVATAALAAGAYLAARTAAHYRTARRRVGRTREVCLGATGVCVEV